MVSSHPAISIEGDQSGVTIASSKSTVDVGANTEVSAQSVLETAEDKNALHSTKIAEIWEAIIKLLARP